MTELRVWDKLHLSPWGRVKAMADHLGYKVERLKGDHCRLLMPNVEVQHSEVQQSIVDIELTDTFAQIEDWLREAIEENKAPGAKKRSR
jgi:hypothetical protein